MVVLAVGRPARRCDTYHRPDRDANRGRPSARHEQALIIAVGVKAVLRMWEVDLLFG